ncbi:MAG: WYL domain-containing protein [Phycisphaeraceae bacterium]
MSADYSRVHRLIRILTLVQGQTGWNASALAEACQTSVRNLYRDLKVLETAGVPVSYDRKTHGYRVRRDFFMPPLELTLEEALALVSLGERVTEDEQVPFTRPAARAIAKVRGGLPRQVNEAVSAMTPHVAIRLAAAQPGDGLADVYDTVRLALAQRQALHCVYEPVQSADAPVEAKPEPFLFKPYCLFFGQRAWYSVGWHTGRDELRTLKLSRFSECRLTETTYTIPDDFSLPRYLGKAWRMIRGSQTYKVSLRFEAKVADTVADTHWHATQRVDWHDDGAITFHCEVDGLDEIVWWVLSYGPHCQVLEPQAMADRVAELAEQTAARYRSDGA